MTSFPNKMVAGDFTQSRASPRPLSSSCHGNGAELVWQEALLFLTIGQVSDMRAPPLFHFLVQFLATGSATLLEWRQPDRQSKVFVFIVIIIIIYWFNELIKTFIFNSHVLKNEKKRCFCKTGSFIWCANYVLFSSILV